MALDNPHPEANWCAFFEKTWYEGYGKPEYAWQASSGTDDLEAKLSLVPAKNIDQQKKKPVQRHCADRLFRGMINVMAEFPAEAGMFQ